MASILAIDFEASCLPRHGRSYPIEVGIASGEGWVRSWLIRPGIPWRDWTWTQEAEALHGITRERLQDEGLPVSAVMEELAAAVRGHRLVADSYLDDDWMRILAAAAGHAPRPGVEHIDALAAQLGLGDAEIRSCLARVAMMSFPRHRAGADAGWLAALIMLMQRCRPDSAPPARQSTVQRLMA